MLTTQLTPYRPLHRPVPVVNSGRQRESRLLGLLFGEGMLYPLSNRCRQALRFSRLKIEQIALLGRGRFMRSALAFGQAA